MNTVCVEECCCVARNRAVLWGRKIISMLFAMEEFYLEGGGTGEREVRSVDGEAYARTYEWRSSRHSYGIG